MRHGWIVAIAARMLRDFEDNPHTQIVIHKWALRFWALNAIVATLVFFFATDFWSKVSIFYIVFISLYANFATDYDALSAAQASLHGIESRDKAQELIIRLTKVESEVKQLKGE